jgi:squalene-associated FAD-dependent desaturase
MTIAVIGGGVSGIRAALTLARAGRAVTLYEKNQHLGGRAFSFNTTDFGEIDIGQHIWLKCCTAFETLLRDLGVPNDHVFRQNRIEIPYRLPGGRSFVLRSTPLPGLLHLLPGVLRFPGLGLRDLLHLGIGMARARFLSDERLESLDSETFASWLHRHGQTPAAIAKLWEPIVLGVCNGRIDEVSARHALFTFRESLLGSRHAADICFFRRPLSAIFDRLARETLQAAGVTVRTGIAVSHVEPGPSARVRFLGDVQTFDRVILALPRQRQRSLLAGIALSETRGTGAIAGLLLKFARPVMGGMFFLGLDSPIQIVFNKTAIWERAGEDGAQLIELVFSGASREVKMGVEAVTAEYLPELAKLLPAVTTTALLARRLVKHGTATFAVPQGGEKTRLRTTLQGCPNTFFAGDEAATGWPSTMESATRAGEAAAQTVLDRINCQVACIR